MLTDWEKKYIRDLAREQMELAHLPVMKERAEMWYDHNELKGKRPMIAVEEGHYWEEMWPELKCTDPLAREMEYQLQNNIQRVELIGDDRVTPDFYSIKYQLYDRMFGLGQKQEAAKEGIGHDQVKGYRIIPQIKVIEEDFEKLSPTEFRFPADILGKKEQMEELLGDILPVKLVNTSNSWGPSPMRQVIAVMGMENAYVSMVTEPEEFHRLMEFITEDVLRLYRFEEENGYMDLNNGNDLTGSGNWCFSRELPVEGFSGRARSRDTWGHLNAEDAAEISPKMFREFILPYQKRLAKEFGLIYYGCCEAISRFWDNGIDQLENVRKVSISPWCDEAFMGERLKGKSIIYSRKPCDYYYLGVQAAFDEAGFRENVKKTVRAAEGCKTEYIFRDVITIHGNVEKVKRAVEIVREETEESY